MGVRFVFAARGYSLTVLGTSLFFQQTILRNTPARAHTYPPTNTYIPTYTGVQQLLARPSRGTWYYPSFNRADIWAYWRVRVAAASLPGPVLLPADLQRSHLRPTETGTHQSLHPRGWNGVWGAVW